MSPMQATKLQCAIALFLMATSGMIITDAARVMSRGLLGNTSPDTVDLRSASGFTVLAYSTVTNTGATTVGGLLGVSPGSEVAGETSVSYFAQPTNNGRASTEEAAAAKADVTTAYNDAKGRNQNVIILNVVNIGGNTLKGGLYKTTGALAVSSGDLTLDGGNSDGSNSDSVFIFQIEETLEVSSGLKIILSGGAQAKNIFWQLGSAATFEVDTVVFGTVMAYSAITVKSGCQVEGRLFALNEAVALDSNVVAFPQ